jgi:hypothetical protein
MEWVVKVTLRPLFNLGKDPVPIVQEAWCAPGPVWTGAENLAPTGIRSQTVKFVASSYTDWDIPTQRCHVPADINIRFYVPRAKHYRVSVILKLCSTGKACHISGQK